jgi:hypothetical protein
MRLHPALRPLRTSKSPRGKKMVMEFQAESPEEAARIVAAIEEETKKLRLDATITTIEVHPSAGKSTVKHGD